MITHLLRFFFSFVLASVAVTNAAAQCNPSSTAPVTFTSVTSTPENCPQSGSITVNGAAGGGGVYMYEIFSGPILRGIQSQNVFPALAAGTYRIRITGCNGKFREAEATITSNYLRSNTQWVTFVPDSSFKCGNTTNGMVAISVNNYVSFPNLADSSKFKYPLRYQISTNSDPYTGFNGVPYHTFAAPERTTSGSGQYEVVYHNNVDTLRNVAAGQTYYIRVTDACGIFITTSLAVPAINSVPYTYQFNLKDPYTEIGGVISYTSIAKGGCPQWGELTVLKSGTAVNTIDNTNTPFTLTITRQDNGSVVASRMYNTGPISRGGNPYVTPIGQNATLYDSLPRVPLNVTITDFCGNTQVIPLNTPLPLPAFKLQAFSQCSGGSYFRTNTILAEPSAPVTWKVYDASSNLLFTQVYNDANANAAIFTYLKTPTTPSNYLTVPSYGLYSIVLTDACGRKDSIQYNFQPGGSTGPTPAYSFATYHSACPAGNIYYTETFKQTVASPVISTRLISGPAGVTFPKAMKFGEFPSGMYFDSLVAGGPYVMEVRYGCNQVYTTNFTVGAVSTATLVANMTFSAPVAGCANTVTNGAGSTTATVTSSDLNSLIADYPFIRITQAPLQFLKNITHSKDGSNPTLPLSLGYYNANSASIYFYNNGLDTTTMNVYPIRTFNYLNNAFLAGSYTFEMYGSCSGTLLKTLSFTVNSLEYKLPTLGASAAYICDNGTDIKLIASPSNGNAPFRYQIKLSTQPDEAYTVLQTANTFALPASTTPGTVYSVRTVDNCGNSYTGLVPVNSFTGEFYVFPFNNCLTATARIITGFMPGATYTWTKPNGTVITTTSNEINISNFSAADFGTYTVNINALNGCIVRTATGVINGSCEVAGPLPVKLESFSAVAQDKKVLLTWLVSAELGLSRYEIEFSTDGRNFNKIGNITATNKRSYTFLHTAPVDGINFYRLKNVDQDGKFSYSDVRKVNFTNNGQLSVYPNPANTDISITLTSGFFNKSATLQVFSQDGKLMLNKKITALSQTETLNVSKFATGKYIVRIATSTTMITTTFEEIH